MPHTTRCDHRERHPVQVTLRAARSAPSLRGPTAFAAVRRAIASAHKGAFRVVHFSAQHDHMHLIVEGADREALGRGVQGLAIRVALAVNRALGRKGPLWGDRYHARALSTPREVRTSLVYVLLNFRKHLRAPPGVDPCSSGRSFDGWREPVRAAIDPPAVAPALTWLGARGWRRAGRISVREGPRAAPPS